MAKSTHAVGPSMTEHEAQDPPIVFSRPQLGLIDQPIPEETEESKSVGIAYSPSSESGSSSSEHSAQAPLEPAPTMENPSNQPETEPASSAASTDGDGLREMRRPSGRPAKKTAPRAARVRSTDEVDEFDI